MATEYQVPNASTLYGELSPHYLSIAQNTMGVAYPSNGSGTTSIGAVVVEPPERLLQFHVRGSDAMGAGESLVLTASFLDADGVTIVSNGVTVDATTLPAAGDAKLFDAVPFAAPAGTVVSLTRVYTAGSANNPAIAVVMQLF